MDAHVATPEHAVLRRWRPAVIGLLRSVLITALAMLWFLAVWMLVRRLTGQMQRPLGFLPLLTVAAVLVAATTLLRLGWQAVTRDQPPRLRFLTWLAPVPATLLLAGALSIAGTSTAALFLLWGMLFVAEVLWWYRGWPRTEGASPSGTEPAAEDVATTSGGAGQPDVQSLVPSTETAEQIDSGTWMAEGMTQQLTRIDAADGTQSMEGVLRSQFEPAERSRSLHVAFCPPLQAVPETTVTQLSGPRCHIKAAEIQTYGARFDVRLATRSESREEVLIHFEAVATAPPSD
jgi:hypothetical protein